MSKTKTDVVIDEKVQQIVLEPEPVKVIMLNDDITPVDFVVELLIVLLMRKTQIKLVNIL